MSIDKLSLIKDDIKKISDLIDDEAYFDEFEIETSNSIKDKLDSIESFLDLLINKREDEIEPVNIKKRKSKVLKKKSKVINPLTNRKITKGGRIYNKLVKEGLIKDE